MLQKAVRKQVTIAAVQFTHRQQTSQKLENKKLIVDAYFLKVVVIILFRVSLASFLPRDIYA